MLHPIGITHSRELVYGLRRLRATERNGGETITARVVYLDDPLRAERDENGCRKDFTLSELVAIGRAIEEREAAKAKERHRDNGGNHGNQHTGGKPKAAGPEKVSPPPETGRAKDKAAAAVGVSRPTYEKAKAVVQSAETDPALTPIVAEMDRTGNVNGAFKVVLVSPGPQAPLKPPHAITPDRPRAARQTDA